MTRTGSKQREGARAARSNDPPFHRLYARLPYTSSSPNFHTRLVDAWKAGDYLSLKTRMYPCIDTTYRPHCNSFTFLLCLPSLSYMLEFLFLSFGSLLVSYWLNFHFRFTWVFSFFLGVNLSFDLARSRYNSDSVYQRGGTEARLQYIHLLSPQKADRRSRNKSSDADALHTSMTSGSWNESHSEGLQLLEKVACCQLAQRANKPIDWFPVSENNYGRQGRDLELLA